MKLIRLFDYVAAVEAEGVDVSRLDATKRVLERAEDRELLALRQGAWDLVALIEEQLITRGERSEEARR